MRWHVDLIHVVGVVLAGIGLWTVAMAVLIAWESRKGGRK